MPSFDPEAGPALRTLDVASRGRGAALRGALEAVPLATLLLDRQHVIRHANRRALTMLLGGGYASDARHRVLGQPLASFGTGSGGDAVRHLLDDLDEDPSGLMRHEAQVRAPSLEGGGRVFWALWVLARLPPSDDDPLSTVVQLVDIDDRKNLEHRVRAESELYQAVFEALPVPTTIANLRGTLVRANAALADALGVERKRVTHRPWRSVFQGPLPADTPLAAAARLLTLSEDGREVMHDARRRPIVGPKGVTLGHVSVHDVVDVCAGPPTVPMSLRTTDAHAPPTTPAPSTNTDGVAQHTGLDELHLSAGVFNNVTDAIVVASVDKTITAVNPAFTQITGYAPREVVGKALRRLWSDRVEPRLLRRVFEVAESNGRAEALLLGRAKGRPEYTQSCRITLVRDSGGEPLEYLVLFSDATAAESAAEEIRRRSNFDPLTGLPNRSLFFDRLSVSLANARRTGQSVTLMFIDLDRFKNVNDTLGHSAGDLLLKETAVRLKGCLRQSDMVARLGGDEFTVILPNVGTMRHAEEVALKLMRELSRPFSLDGQQAYVAASIGITVAPRDGLDPETLIKNADTAMYKAKEGGRNGFRFFTAAMNHEAQERMWLETEMRRGLEAGEFMPFFQPVVDVRTMRVVSAEALARWHHPQRGLVSPGAFIPVAEDTGLVEQLGERILRAACRQLGDWQRRLGVSLRLSVNVSSRQLRRDGFVDLVARVLHDTGIPRGYLTLEITETAFIEDPDAVGERLRALKELGVNLSLDDFGTGYSSLTYLRRFPIDTLKIDRCFVKDAPNRPDDAALVEAVIGLGQSLDIEVVGEGVETEEHLVFLKERGCRLIQGFYFSEPMPAAEFERVITRRRRPK